MVVPVITCLTSFYAGFVMFSVIGFMAHEANLPVKDVVTSGLYKLESVVSKRINCNWIIKIAV